MSILYNIALSLTLTLEETMGVEPTNNSGRRRIRASFGTLSPDAELIGYQVPIYQVCSICDKYSYAVFHIETYVQS